MARHRPVRFRTLLGGNRFDAAPDAWRGRKVVAASAIARPESFVETLRDLGCEVVEQRRYVDHHRFRPADLAELRALGRSHDAPVVVTEKDAVKLEWLLDDEGSHPDRPVVSVLEIDLEFLGDAPEIPRVPG